MRCGKTSKGALNPCVTYNKQQTRFGTLYIHSYILLYVFLLCFGGYLLFLLLISFSYYFTGVAGGFFGCDFISCGLILFSLSICVLLFLARESVYRSGYFPGFLHFVVILTIILHVHTHTHTHIHKELYAYIPMYTYIYTNTHVPTYLPTYIHTYIHTYVYTFHGSIGVL